MSWGQRSSPESRVYSFDIKKNYFGFVNFQHQLKIFFSETVFSFSAHFTQIKMIQTESCSSLLGCSSDTSMCVFVCLF